MNVATSAGTSAFRFVSAWISPSSTTSTILASIVLPIPCRSFAFPSSASCATDDGVSRIRAAALRYAPIRNESAPSSSIRSASRSNCSESTSFRGRSAIAAMIGGMREVTDATFDDEVLAAEQPVVVDFWAPWCGPCKAIEPALEELPLEVVKLDIDANPSTAARYGVLSLPTVILFAGGEPRETVHGARPKKHFEKAFSAYLGLNVSSCQTPVRVLPAGELVRLAVEQHLDSLALPPPDRSP